MLGDSTYRWSASSSVTVCTEEGFGSGRSNTKEMLEREETNSNTIWGVINGNTGEERDEGPEWFVPSREELAAFGVALEITTINYSTFGLSSSYWSSSQNSALNDYYVNFNNGNILTGFVNGINSVRLATTF